MDDATSMWLDVLVPVDRSAAPPRSLDDLWELYQAKRALGASPFAAAVQAAARVDRLGHAFAVGYPAALEHMVGRVEVPCALCVTESGGNAPRAIEASLAPSRDGYRLRGEKTFVTFGTRAETLLVACRIGEQADGRPDLAMVRIPANRQGVVLHELPPMAFVPEVLHARIELDDVPVAPEERLPGDGYLGYVKPFRTIEDIHVIAAALAYLIGLAVRVGASAELISTIGAALAALEAIHAEPALDPRVHLVLHGIHEHAKSILESSDLDRLFQAAPEDERVRWSRDRALLDIAAKARAARFVRAREALGA